MTDACIRGCTGLPLLRALEELAAEAYRGVWEFFHTAVTAREGILGTLMCLHLAVPMNVLHHSFTDGQRQQRIALRAMWRTVVLCTSCNTFTAKESCRATASTSSRSRSSRAVSNTRLLNTRLLVVSRSSYKFRETFCETFFCFNKQRVTDFCAPEAAKASATTP